MDELVFSKEQASLIANCIEAYFHASCNALYKFPFSETDEINNYKKSIIDMIATNEGETVTLNLNEDQTLLLIVLMLVKMYYF